MESFHDEDVSLFEELLEYHQDICAKRAQMRSEILQATADTRILLSKNLDNVHSIRDRVTSFEQHCFSEIADIWEAAGDTFEGLIWRLKRDDEDLNALNEVLRFFIEKLPFMQIQNFRDSQFAVASDCLSGKPRPSCGSHKAFPIKQLGNASLLAMYTSTDIYTARLRRILNMFFPQSEIVCSRRLNNKLTLTRRSEVIQTKLVQIPASVSKPANEPLSNMVSKMCQLDCFSENQMLESLPSQQDSHSVLRLLDAYKTSVDARHTEAMCMIQNLNRSIDNSLCIQDALSDAVETHIEHYNKEIESFSTKWKDRSRKRLHLSNFPETLEGKIVLNFWERAVILVQLRDLGCRFMRIQKLNPTRNAQEVEMALRDLVLLDTNNVSAAFRNEVTHVMALWVMPGHDGRALYSQVIQHIDTLLSEAGVNLFSTQRAATSPSWAEEVMVAESLQLMGEIDVNVELSSSTEHDAQEYPPSELTCRHTDFAEAQEVTPGESLHVIDDDLSMCTGYDAPESEPSELELSGRTAAAQGVSLMLAEPLQLSSSELSGRTEFAVVQEVPLLLAESLQLVSLPAAVMGKNDVDPELSTSTGYLNAPSEQKLKKLSGPTEMADITMTNAMMEANNPTKIRLAQRLCSSDFVESMDLPAVP
ncbi:hypothetical protein EV361DRAFT_872667 [Lentinula raphanica]|nr:hypothetical protein EV361DRAFT_872667 [Lentinula raphanica]